MVNLLGSPIAISLSRYNRAAFVSTQYYSAADGMTATATYDGVSMTGLWELDAPGAAENSNCAGYVLAGIPTTAKTVQATFSASSTDCVLGCLTFTGVDQTTPTGDVQTANSSGTSSSLTCTGVGRGDVVVGGIARQWSGEASLTVGANQNDTTQGWNLKPEFNGLFGCGSTQAGANGGVMSWSWTDSASFVHGAVVLREGPPRHKQVSPIAFGGC